MQHTVYSTQHAAYSIQHTACSIQHRAYSVQCTIHSIEHPAHSIHPRACIKHTAYSIHSKRPPKNSNTFHKPPKTTFSFTDRQAAIDDGIVEQTSERLAPNEGAAVDRRMASSITKSCPMVAAKSCRLVSNSIK